MKTMNNNEIYELKIILNEVYIEYKYVFRKYRKQSSHFSRNGLYKQWVKNRYKEIVDE